MINRSMPQSTVMPVLVYNDIAKASDWLCAAFGFTERLRAGDHHAKQHSARILRPPADYAFGERQYTVEDIGGHQWTFSQSVADVDPQDWGATTFATE